MTLAILVETWICPFNPDDNCKLKTKPLVFSGCALLKASCKANVLLEAKLTVLVSE